jgi:hypothetical protein
MCVQLSRLQHYVHRKKFRQGRRTASARTLLANPITMRCTPTINKDAMNCIHSRGRAPLVPSQQRMHYKANICERDADLLLRPLSDLFFSIFFRFAKMHIYKHIYVPLSLCGMQINTRADRSECRKRRCCCDRCIYLFWCCSRISRRSHWQLLCALLKVQHFIRFISLLSRSGVQRA